MVYKLGANRATNDTAVNTTITLNSSTATTIKSANPNRIFFRIDNIGFQDVILKLQAASVDDIKRTILVSRGGGFWEMPPDKVYTGEISAITINGSVDVYITEY